MKKIVTVVGARPQFIKAAAISGVLREHFTEVLVHTGQHYDYNMSQQFFDELFIPHPIYNLGISGGSHGEMTAQMLVELEKVLMQEAPDMLLVYGDTNSTLAACLAAAKLSIPVCHVEAGVRTGSRTNPEEINRRCADNLSSLLLTCTQTGLNNLKSENLGEQSRFVGDPMYDAFLIYKKASENAAHSLIALDGKALQIPCEFCYLTCHRQENTETDEALTEILKAMEALPFKTVYPVHPRNKERATRICEKNNFKNTLLCLPVGYLTSIYLVQNAKKVVTDSGGLQREAFFAEVQCVTVLPFPVWEETLVDNRNALCAPKSEDILEKLNCEQRIDTAYLPFGNGDSGKKILSAISSFLK